jgi:hypothetical protein
LTRVRWVSVMRCQIWEGDNRASGVVWRLAMLWS